MSCTGKSFRLAVSRPSRSGYDHAPPCQPSTINDAYKRPLHAARGVFWPFGHNRNNKEMAMATDYTQEMCLFLLKNKSLIEGTSLVEQVEAVVFKAINKVIEKRIGPRNPWRTRYGLVAPDEEGNDDTFFAPLDWPVKADMSDLVGYRLWETEKEVNYTWLAHVFGINDVTLCFDFWMGARVNGPSLYKIKQRLEAFLAENEAVRNAGFHYHERGTLFLPFVLDAAQVAEEYPNLKKSLAPVEAALEKLMSVNPEFDKLVKEFLPHQPLEKL